VEAMAMTLETLFWIVACLVGYLLVIAASVVYAIVYATAEAKYLDKHDSDLL